MPMLWRAKLGAFLIHLLFSIIVISSFLLVVTQLWFPDSLFQFEDVWEGLAILLPVDAILGPMMTLIIFAPRKKGLVLDIAIIVAVQLAALAYGASAIYSARPEVMAFTGDRFEIVTHAKFDAERFQENEFQAQQLGYPLVVYALPGQTTEEHSEFVLNNVQYQHMPERYRPLEDYAEVVLEKALLIDGIVPRTQTERQILEQFKSTFSPEQQALFILQGTARNFIIMALDKNNWKITGYLELDPWEVYKPQQD